MKRKSNDPTSQNEYQKRGRILLADDDLAIVDTMSMMLEDAGYAVETVVDEAVVQETRKHLPDLLLLDIWMSGMDGREICKQLKGQEKTKHIPVIMVSADKDTGRLAKEAGADDFLAKPFDIDDLLAKVAKYMK
jgi:CheY-like chemotaxis protein